MKKIFDKIIGSSSDCKKLIDEINKLEGIIENPVPNENIIRLVRKISKEDTNINEKDDEMGKNCIIFML